MYAMNVSDRPSSWSVARVTGSGPSDAATADHRLAAQAEVAPDQLRDEAFISVSRTAPVLREVIDDYLRRMGFVLIATLLHITKLVSCISWRNTWFSRRCIAGYLL